MRIRTIMALAPLVAGCPSETVAPPPAPPVNWQSFDAGAKASVPPPGPTEKERAIAEGYAAAIASPSFEALQPLLNDESHFAFPGSDDAHGAGPIVRAHRQLLGAFDSRKVVVRRVWRSSSQQTVEWELSGIHARDWMGIKASQRAVAIKGIALISTTDDGSITELHLYFDVAAVKAELGSGPKEIVDALAQGAASLANGAPEAAQVFDQESSPAEQSHVAVARAALDALESNDLAAYEGTMSDDVQVHTLERLQPWRGKADVASYFHAMHKAIGQLDTTVSYVAGIGDFVVLEYMVAGEQLAPIHWIPPQGDRALVLHVVDVVEIAAGKETQVWRYDNPTEIARTPPS
jgi:hypothetical protein